MEYNKQCYGNDGKPNSLINCIRFLNRKTVKSKGVVIPVE